MKRMNWMRWGAAAALTAGMAFAQAPATGNPQAPAGQRQQMTRQQRREQFEERMSRELNLTPAQQQQAKDIFGRMRDNAKPIREEMRRNRDALETAIQANNTRDIHSLTAKQATLLGQLMEMRADARAKFYTILTPEQKVKAQQIEHRMRERWEQREHPTS
ncbi:MAG TPA: Spy/CpxP family protein refolding chaperone [Bryobacteraceae bacterium]|nr:Spy/CpxP family protein refolding chaperone [Bryobacteraceae bacterium]